LKKITKIMLILTSLVIALVVVSPLVFSRSNEPCASCHSSRGYYQYLDILEGDSGNQIPTTLSVTQTVTVKVVVQNEVNSPRYTDLSSVSLTLRSIYGHFQVSSPTYSVGGLSPGTATATWQITGTSDGYDYLEIKATGYNNHFNCYFSDAYSPSQPITVGTPTGTPPPLPTPTPAPPTTPAPSTPQPSLSTPAQTSTPATTTNPSNTPQPTTSPATTLSIELVSPTQGAHLPTASKQTIQWQASGGSGTLKVKLEYIITNQQWITLTTDLPASGSYQWTTPDTASTCAVRATVQDSATQQSTTTSFEVEKAAAFDWTIIAVAGTVAVVLVVVVIIVFKMRAKKPA
jgi:hypothetical protein